MDDVQAYIFHGTINSKERQWRYSPEIIAMSREIYLDLGGEQIHLIPGEDYIVYQQFMNEREKEEILMLEDNERAELLIKYSKEVRELEENGLIKRENARTIVKGITEQLDEILVEQ